MFEARAGDTLLDVSVRWLVSVFVAALVGAGSTAAAFMLVDEQIAAPPPAPPAAPTQTSSPVECEAVDCTPVACLEAEPPAEATPMRRRRPTEIEVLDPWDPAGERPPSMTSAMQPSTAVSDPWAGDTRVLNPWE